MPLAAADPRWIVADRPDGTNVNAWHWTATDATLLAKAALCRALESTNPSVFAGCSELLGHAKLTSAATRGECSINTRKGRRFIIYELAAKVVWQGEVRGADGAVLESSSGELELADISAETLDDLEVTFSTNARGSPLSEAMRKEGTAAVKRTVQRCMGVLQDHIAKTEEQPAAAAATAAAVAPADAPPSPAAIAAARPPPPRAGSEPAPPSRSARVEPTASCPAASGGTASAEGVTKLAAAGTDEADPVASGPPASAPPIMMRMMLAKMKSSPKGHVSSVKLAACSLVDAHMGGLIEVLHSSSVEIREIDRT